LAYSAGGIRQQDLADAYHVNRSNIGHIVTHRTWR
jgi:plasmid maintenance system antidote protein VapI